MKRTLIYKKNGCRVLRNLARNDDNKKTIATEGGIKVILDAMKRHEANADVQQHGSNALRNLDYFLATSKCC